MNDMVATEVLAQVLAQRIVPVVVIDRAGDAQPLGDALVAGGLPVAEVTFRTAAAPDAIRALAARGDVLVGAGTVCTPAQAQLACRNGARFLVSPGLSRAVIEWAHEHGVPVLPGVMTPSEVMAALDLGVEVVKFFPAQVAGGVGMLKALAGPFPDVRFVPTGGISADTMADYLALPCVAAVGASWLVERSLVAGGQVDQISDRLRAAVRIANRQGA
ncbi:bifunctional 4-hydroxy-2-oxoglutarate aldolase/2-dehydro-3-deoxy-phosphogluconate aldolase [Propionibacteriaceae bacterium G1746]|uniref:bifunctional 4-hydroxy-2-oxoglutarate aldolase/2-dehydro-3-deoxy-phosphogluconate aldolase n=1 Tax=Aestuariimicrobium sp. G57 TaxID=3418485 RepID=UPI003C265944